MQTRLNFFNFVSISKFPLTLQTGQMKDKEKSASVPGTIWNEDPQNFIYPTKRRRIIVLLVWYLVTVVVLMFLAHVIGEKVFNIEVYDNDRMPVAFRIVKYLIQFLPLLIFFMLGAKGRLPGAMRTKKN